MCKDSSELLAPYIFSQGPIKKYTEKRGSHNNVSLLKQQD